MKTDEWIKKILHTCAHTHPHAHTQMHVCTCTHTMHTCTHTYTCTHTHAYTHTHTHAHTHTMEHYSAIEKNELMPFVTIVDGPRDYHTKPSRSDKDKYRRQIS